MRFCQAFMTELSKHIDVNAKASTMKPKKITQIKLRVLT
jgi:hypothetical protein